MRWVFACKNIFSAKVTDKVGLFSICFIYLISFGGHVFIMDFHYCHKLVMSIITSFVPFTFSFTVPVFH